MNKQLSSVLLATLVVASVLLAQASAAELQPPGTEKRSTLDDIYASDISDKGVGNYHEEKKGACLNEPNEAKCKLCCGRSGATHNWKRMGVSFKTMSLHKCICHSIMTRNQ